MGAGSCVAPKTPERWGATLAGTLMSLTARTISASDVCSEWRRRLNVALNAVAHLSTELTARK